MNFAQNFYPAAARSITAVSAAARSGTQPYSPPEQRIGTPPATPPTAPPAAPDDWARAQDAGEIVFGTAADYPPFEFYNSNFAMDGFDIALAKAIGEQLGLEVRFKDYAFDGVLNAVQLGDVDAAIAAISVTPDRQAA